MFVLQAHFMSKNKIGTNICFTLNLLGHHFDYDHHFIMVFILRPFFHKLGSQEDLQRISFMLPVSESHCCSENIVDLKIIKDRFETRNEYHRTFHQLTALYQSIYSLKKVNYFLKQEFIGNTTINENEENYKLLMILTKYFYTLPIKYNLDMKLFIVL